jgi:replicative DNA helicase
MTGGQIAKRVIEIAGEGDDGKFKKNIIISDEILDVEEICADAAKLTAVDTYGMIAIDFADLMLTEKEEEGNVAQLYRSVARLAKKSGVPVVLLSQLNRQYAEQGGVPRIQNIRWSGMAESLAALILLIYNPNQIFGAPPSKNQTLQPHVGRAYIVCGKSRYGFKQGGVGAVDVEWNGKESWADTAMGWFPLTSV